MVKNVVIVGGGSAGWMTAAYLTRALSDVHVTVVESPTVPIIGVGEATFSTVKLFFDFLGLEEHEWMPACNATYKLGIKFVDWGGDGGHFYHPFQRYEVVDGYNLGEWWLKLMRGVAPFDSSCFVTPALCDAMRSPRFFDGTVFDDNVRELFAAPEGGNNVMANHRVQYPYAYHFDAALLARFLRDYAVRLGAKQILDNVVDVAQREDGSIDYVQTQQQGAVRGDLFVDCTGFRGLLINRTLGEPFLSFADHLLCDRAVALRVPRDAAQRGIEPFTSATTLSAGWVWNIPLYGRVGTGYVYSSRFLDKDQAERELHEHLGPQAEGLQPNHIAMRVGRCRNSWVKNCVAIGLASGFVEPLESTGIFFTQHGIEELVRHFPADGFEEQAVRGYNRQVAHCIDGVLDFLILHYRAARRTDTEFWRATEHIALTDRLAELLPLWARRLPDDRSINPYFHGFEAYSYSVMLLGLGYQPPAALPVLDHLDPLRALEAFHSMRQRSEFLQRKLPTQYDYLTQMRHTAGEEGRTAMACS
jgi:tryptophan halogenase